MTNIISFLPGPVQISEEVKQAFFESPLSHRSDTFKEEHREVKKLLTALTRAKFIEINSGSGTAANDMIAMELTKLSQKGLILCNGEFGERLIHHGTRAGLDFSIYKTNPGDAFDMNEIEKRISRNRKIKWIWFVHSETSTGVLNDLPSIQQIGNRFEVKVCADCMSSIGNIPLDLSDLYLASASSNKGLSSYAGLAFVFYNHTLQYKKTNIPTFLDLSYYRLKEGIPFTISTNLISCMKASLKNIHQHHFDEIQRKSGVVCDLLRDNEYKIVGHHTNRNPSVITIELPDGISSYEMGKFLLKHKVYTSFESQHLKENNWLQISLMGVHSESELNLLKDSLIQFSMLKIEKKVEA